MKPFKMALPRTVGEAVSISPRSSGPSKLLAGGTDLLGELKDEIRTPEQVVNLKAIREGDDGARLRAIRRTDRGLEIGALATLTQVAEAAAVRRHWPALATTILKTATPQLRNVGTLGGNICQRPRCWYYRHPEYACLKKEGTRCYAQTGENEYHAIFHNAVCCVPHASNVAPVLIAYDAGFEIQGPGGVRIVAAERFFVPPEKNVTVENILRPNEVLTRVILPPGSENPHSAYCEAREKQSFDWALCGATASLRIEGERIRDARIVLSAVAPTPLRRPDLEQKLVGQPITIGNTLDDVTAAAVASATPLEHNRYKVALVRTTLKRAIQQALKGSK